MSRHGGRGRGGFLGGLGLGALSLAGVAGTIGATWKFMEFTVKAKQLFEVRKENAVFVRLVDSARIDLEELERLMALPEIQDTLRDYPEKVRWIQGKVAAMNDAMGSITKYTKGVADAWFLGPKTRIWWVIHEKEKLYHRQMELAVAKEGIMEVIGFLTPYEFDNEEKKREEEKRRMEESNIRYSKNVNVDVDVDIDRRERQVIEYDRDGRPIRTTHKEYREYDFDIEEDEYEPPRRRRQDLTQAGFYQGELDGPLATRPRFWSQRDAGADYREVSERKIVREEVRYSDSEDSGMGRGVPLRVHWPTQAKL